MLAVDVGRMPRELPYIMKFDGLQIRYRVTEGTQPSSGVQVVVIRIEPIPGDEGCSVKRLAL